MFFDALNMKWEYEPEGFEVGLKCDLEHEDSCHEEWCHQPSKYLPDFFLPETETWVEVKGADNHIDRTLLCKALDWGEGLPLTYNSRWSKRGLLILGPVPRPDRWPFHAILQHWKGVELTLALFTERGFEVTASLLNVETYGDSSTGSYDYNGPLCDLNQYSILEIPRPVAQAYAAARSARFEHGDREVW